MSDVAVIVDDDELVARGVATSVASFGYVTRTAHNAAAAIALIREVRPQIAIVDVDLRELMTGIDIANAVTDIDVPILLLTGRDDTNISELGDERVIGFLTKPTSRVALRTTIALLRKQQRGRDELERHRYLLAESQRIAKIGSYRFDYRTSRISWTEETYRLYGVSSATFTPSPETILPLIHPRDRAMMAMGMQPLPAGVPRSAALDYSVLLADGTERKLRSHAEMVGPDGESPHSVVGTIRDVTEEERVLDANRAKTTFLAHMSHELRTPLNAVLGLSEAMIEKIFGDLNDAQINTLQTIHNSGRHLLALINDLLDLTRIESGKLEIDAEQIVLRPLLDEATTLMSSHLAAKDQRLVIDLAPSLPPVDVDKRRIKQVLLNLLENASKFSPEGALVTVRAVTDPVRREVNISVSDTGPGIAQTDLDRIFEPFVTVDPTMTRKHGGAGLGLALSKRIVELHAGHLRVASELGRGTTFTIDLPMSATYVGAPPRIPAPRPVKTNGVVVLAEDNEATVLAVRTYLEHQGYELRVVTDGISALEAASQSDVGIVLLDVQLPGLDGLEVTRRLRERKITTPIVTLTAHAMPEDERRCLDAGASAYMAKPVRLRVLADTISRLMEG